MVEQKTGKDISFDLNRVSFSQRPREILGIGNHLEVVPHPSREDRVYKWFHSSINPTVAILAVNHHLTYVQTLQGLKVPLPFVEMKSLGNDNWVEIYIEQDRFYNHEMGSHIVRSHSASNVENFTRLLTKNVFNFIANRQSSDIGLDPHYKNFALRNGSVILLDTFPPLLDSESLAIMVQKLGRTKRIRSLAHIPGLVETATRCFYESPRIVASMYRSLRHARPDICSNLRGIVETELNTFEASFGQVQWRDKLLDKLKFIESSIGGKRVMRLLR